MLAVKFTENGQPSSPRANINLLPCTEKKKKSIHLCCISHASDYCVQQKKHDKIQKSNNSKKKKHIKRRPHIKPEMNSLHESGREL